MDMEILEMEVPFTSYVHVKAGFALQKLFGLEGSTQELQQNFSQNESATVQEDVVVLEGWQGHTRGKKIHEER